MREIVAFNHVSADGFFSSTDGKLDWTVQDEEVFKATQKGMPEADTVLFGRKTYDMFASFWPHVLQQKGPSAPDPHGGRPSEQSREMARWLTAANKVVFSRSRTDVPWENSHLIHEFDASAVAAMKALPGKAMLIFGSGSIASLLTQHGLIDQYVFVVSPVLLGDGRPLLDGVTRRRSLGLLECTQHPTGTISMRYAPRR